MVIQRYFEEEIQPYVPDAFIDWDDVRIGYEINFARYFYEYEAPPSREEIAGKIAEAERESQERLSQILGSTAVVNEHDGEIA
jgi:type I restriction enzyme M protein